MFRCYGAKGIDFRDRWESFEAFFEDMGPCPEGLSLDRIDNTKGYTKDNCRWATNAIQSRNKSTNRMIEIGSRVQCLTDWCKEYGISQTAVWNREKCGWSVVEAITTPTRFHKPRS